jgi:alpha-beta hydrolase superfamily lysophospholipase
MALTKMLIYMLEFHVLEWLILSRIIILLKTDGVCGMKLKWERQKTDSLLFVDRSAIHFIDNLKAPILIFQGENDTNVPKWSKRYVCEKLKS